MRMQRCVQCGCDDLHACELPDGARCYWVLDDLCSNAGCLRKETLLVRRAAIDKLIEALDSAAAVGALGAE